MREPASRCLLFLLLSPLALLCLAGAAPATAESSRQGEVLLRAQDPRGIAEQYGLTLLRRSHLDGGELALARIADGMDAEQTVSLLAGDPAVEAAEAVELAGLPVVRPASHSAATAEAAPDLHRTGNFTSPCLAAHLGPEVWSGFADQRAADLIALHQGHLRTGGRCGSGTTIAVIDTGVDAGHPLLQGALAPGYDFLEEAEGTASEWSGLDFSMRAIVEFSMRAIVEGTEVATLQGQGEIASAGAGAPVLDEQAIATLQDLDLPAYFGHGTMVAGLLRLTAPGARIMPLRVFDSDGTGHVFDIVRAIYWAVDHGADVINMSFSMAEPSKELHRALKYAHRHGVVTVAAAGNQGERAHTYPATLAETFAATCSTDADELCAFSNFGAHLADVAAPGSAVISLYPGGLFAVGWGTSFSAPMVAGTAALIHHLEPGDDFGSVERLQQHLRQGSTGVPALTGLVKGGRLDCPGALAAAEP